LPMATHRQRMLKAFSFDNPDKLPIYYHPSMAGLYVHGQKLADLFNAYPPDNYADFDKIPQPPADAFDADGSYHEFVTDEWGVEWEYRIFGIAGHPRKCPLADWANLESYELPALHEVDKSEVARVRGEYLVWAPLWVSIFEKISALRPFEEVLMDLQCGDSNMVALVEKICDWHRRSIDVCIDAGYDVFLLADDWGTQQGLFLAPEFFRSFFKPRIAELIGEIHKAGRLVVYHSCGAVEPLFEDLVEIGIDGLWHQSNLYEPQAFAEKAAEAKVLLYVHLDRQNLIPLGSPAEIRDAVKQYAEIHKALGGGAILYAEIENDAPFENVEAMIKAMNQYR